MSLDFTFNECLNKTVFIKINENEDINIEYIDIDNINDYNDLKNYISHLRSEHTLFEYYYHNK